MSYAQYGLVQASDYNTLVGANPGSTANALNTVWATGSAGAGYGQTALANVTAGNSVVASDWANLVNRTANAATHQGTSITAVTAPVSGGTVTYLSAIPTNLSAIYSNRYAAATQGTSASNANTYSSAWTNSVTFTHTVTFANGDAARYFFNAGGQLKVTTSHSPTTTTMDTVFKNLASNVGTVVMSSITSGTVSIAGTSYTGITKVGGGGNAPSPYLTANGYYAQGTGNTTVFSQNATGAPTNYSNSYISITTKTNGAQGANGDVGNVITVYTKWGELANTGLSVSSGATTTVTAVFPELTNLPANTWGAVTITGSSTIP